MLVVYINRIERITNRILKHFPIDVVMIQKDGEVIKLVENTMPWKLLLPKRKVKHIIEMQSGLCKKLGISIGTKLNVSGVFG